MACEFVQLAPPQVQSALHFGSWSGKMSKKLINEPERAVDESLAGLVTVNSGLKLLEGHRVVVRADVQQVVEERKVHKSVYKIKIQT